MENKITSRAIKGTAFREDYDYLKRKKGSMGLKEIEKRMAKAGYPLELENINITKWYPIEYRTAYLYAIKDAFTWNDSDIFNMATESPKVATTMRFFLKYIVSPETAFKSASKYWDNYFNFGKLVPLEYNGKDCKMILKLEDFEVDPIYCPQLSGYFVGVGRLTKMKNPKIVELECVHKGGSYHMFKIWWE